MVTELFYPDPLGVYTPAFRRLPLLEMLVTVKVREGKGRNTPVASSHLQKQNPA